MLHEDLPAAGSRTGPNADETKIKLPAVGRILDGRFLIKQDLSDPIFSGAFSCFLVNDLRELNREGILKTTDPGPGHPVDKGPAYQRVCEVLKRLSHFNIEEILETGVLNNRRPYSLVRIAEGRDLARILSAGRRLTLESAARIIEDTAEALRAAHERRILHCDVRPGNIFISGHGGSTETVRLVNFGSAWPIDLRGESLASLPAGSEPFYYAAPELLSPLGHRSAASDVYSLAALAYRMLAGRVPYDRTDRTGLLRAIEKGEPPSLLDLRTDLSQEAQRIIFSGLNFEPAWRPQNIEDVGSRLAAAIRVGPRRPAAVSVPPPAAVKAVPVITRPLPDGRKRKEREMPPAAAAPTSSSSDRTVVWALIFLLLAGALSIPVGQAMFKEEKARAAVNTMRERASVQTVTRQISYLVEGPDSPDTQPTAARGYRLSLPSVPDGKILVFSETETDSGHTIFRLIQRYEPSQAVGKSSAMPAEIPVAGQVQAAWIVWSQAPVTEVEAAALAAAPDGTIDEAAARDLRHFLERNKGRSVSASEGELPGQTVLEGSGSRIVHRFVLNK